MNAKTNTEKINYSLLLNALESGILSPEDSVFDMLMTVKKERIKKIHNYAITPPKTGNRWQTYYKGQDGKRKIIKAQTEDDLIEKLIFVYSSESHIDKMIFHELYEEWLAYKETVSDSQNTIKRHKQHYRKYFTVSCLHDRKIKHIDELMLERECNRIVRDYNLPRKEWCNIKTILNGMYQYAIRRKYLTDNPMDKVQILVRFKQVIRKTGKTETYNSDELKELNQYLDQMYEETQDTVFLAVKLNFFIGLRVGELVSTRFSDISDNHLHIVREEVRNQVTYKYEVVEHTKTNRDRFVFLVPKAIEILKMIPQSGEYIFMRDGERITSRMVAYVLEKYAERQGLATKSTHKMRKTYASLLNANGVPLDSIREQLGHSDLNTTLGYIYNPLTEKETHDLMTKAL